MALSRSKIALIHIAASQLGIDDDTRRDILFAAAGVLSSTELDDEGYGAVMDAYRKLGFESDRHKAAAFGSEQGRRYQGMASPRQVDLIRQLWSEVTDGDGTDAALNKWLESRFKLSALRFVDSPTARKVITGLQSWKNRKILRKDKSRDNLPS